MREYRSRRALCRQQSALRHFFLRLSGRRNRVPPVIPSGARQSHGGLLFLRWDSYSTQGKRRGMRRRGKAPCREQEEGNAEGMKKYMQGKRRGECGEKRYGKRWKSHTFSEKRDEIFPYRNFQVLSGSRDIYGAARCKCAKIHVNTEHSCKKLYSKAAKIHI